MMSTKLQEKRLWEHQRRCSIFTCELCLEQKSSSHEKFRHVGNSKSSHNYCNECIASHVRAKIEDGFGKNISCPDLNCVQTLNPVELQAVIPRDIFVRWCDRLGELYISDFKKCYCPYKNCSEPILNECRDENVKKCLCPKCKRTFCYECKEVPWHEGYWCSEIHQQKDPNEDKFRRLMKTRNWTRCPGCGQPIELVSGCDNVKCRCGRRFCHRCGSFLHYGTCDCRGFLQSVFFFALIIGLAIVVVVFFIWKGILAPQY